MKITYLLSLFIICNAFCIDAQTAILDSLRQELQQAETDSARIYWAGRLVWSNLRYSPDSAQYYIHKGRAWSEHTNKIGEVNRFRHYQGLIHRIRGEYPAAIDTFKIVLRFHENNQDSMKMTAPLFNLGVVYSYLGDYVKSMQYYQQELAINEKLGTPLQAANSLNSIGNLYNNQQDYQKAYETFAKAKTIFVQENNQEQLAMVLQNMGDNFLGMQLVDSAEIYAIQSLEIDRDLERPWGVAHSLALLTEITRKKGDYPTALKYAMESLRIRQQLKQPKDIAYSLTNLGKLQREMGQVDASVKNLKAAIVIADSIHALEILSQSYETLAKSEAKRNNYQQAYLAQQAFQQYHDSLLNVDKTKALQELGIQYDLQGKEKELKNLQQESELKATLAAQERRGRIAWTIATILLAFLTAALALWYRQRLLKNQLINYQKNSLQQSRIDALEQNQKILAFATTLNAQENERKRIAKDLHDSLGSLLATIRLHFKSIQQQIPLLHQSEAYLKTKSLLLQAGDEVRRISHNMMPDVLQLGLPTAIAELVDDLNSATTVHIQFQQLGNCNGKINDQQNIMLYRIAQELLQNALKHAESKNIWTQLICKEHQLQLIVEDDGKGFELNTENFGLGLRNIRSRVEVIGGHLQIDSKLNTGTTALISVNL